MGGAWRAARGMGTLQAPLAEMSGPHEAEGPRRQDPQLLSMKRSPCPSIASCRSSRRTCLNARPGDDAPWRVDRQHKVGYLQKDGRRATFEYYLVKVKNDLCPRRSTAGHDTPYFSGASIKDIVNEGLVIRDPGRQRHRSTPTS